MEYLNLNIKTWILIYPQPETLDVYGLDIEK